MKGKLLFCFQEYKLIKTSFPSSNFLKTYVISAAMYSVTIQIPILGLFVG